MKLPIGIDSFEKLITNNYTFVDKSLFIRDIISEGSEVLLIARPRRFGKTINMSMLECFLSINKKTGNLFDNLNISEYKELCNKYQNKHPVVFVSFKNLGVGNYDNLESGMRSLLKDLYLEHKEFLYNSLDEANKKLYAEIVDETSNYINTQKSLMYLSQFYEKIYNKKAFILIDEYDTPIYNAYNNGFYDKAMRLIRDILGASLKGNNSLYKGVLTGVTKISSESLFSDLNNLDVYTIINSEFGSYFGFSEEEVKGLFDHSKLEVNLDDIKYWYNGYKIGSFTIYNPWSIINCLNRDGELDAYWINTSQNLLIKRLLNTASDTVKFYFEKLLQRQIIELPVEDNLVFPELEDNDGALFTLLLYSGYLKTLSLTRKRGRKIASFAIPNEEVSIIYENIFEKWFECAKGLDIFHYEKFINSLKDNQLGIFEQTLRNYISETGSYFDFNKNTKEQVFHSFILGLIVGLKEHYIIKSNIESGFGRFDVAFIPKDKNNNGIIIEFKVTKNLEDLESKASAALEQITEKKYTKIFKENNINKVSAIGLAFCGKEVKLKNVMLDSQEL